MLDELALRSGIFELPATGADEVHAASSVLIASAHTGIQDNVRVFMFML
ncbi:MAG: hypothetical protein AAB134_03830 [Pseudomonadota bacterium]